MNLDAQIACLKNEVSRRKDIYPHLVKSGKMSEDCAELEIIKMEAAFQTLSQLKGILK